MNYMLGIVLDNRDRVVNNIDIVNLLTVFLVKWKR